MAQSQMYHVNPSKGKGKKGGGNKTTAASSQKRSGRVKRAAGRIKSSFGKFNFMNHLVMPAVMCGAGIIITRVIKKFIINKMSFLPNETTKNFAAAGAAAAVFFFGRKLVPNASMLIAGALALPVIDAAASLAPNMFAGLVYDGDPADLSGAADAVLNSHNSKAYTPALNGWDDKEAVM